MKIGLIYVFSILISVNSFAEDSKKIIMSEITDRVVLSPDEIKIGDKTVKFKVANCCASRDNYGFIKVNHVLILLGPTLCCKHVAPAIWIEFTFEELGLVPGDKLSVEKNKVLHIQLLTQ
jgi:hypothetical protein